MSEPQQTGLEYLRSFVDSNAAPFGKLLGFHLAEVEFGRVVFEGKPDETHYNPHGIVHGGYAASMLDSALGCCVQTTLPAGQTYTTIELKINYVRAMTAETGLVRATATSIHTGRRMATSEGRLVDPNGKLIAHGSTTCMILS